MSSLFQKPPLLRPKISKNRHFRHVISVFPKWHKIQPPKPFRPLTSFQFPTCLHHPSPCCLFPSSFFLPPLQNHSNMANSYCNPRRLAKTFLAPCSLKSRRSVPTFLFIMFRPLLNSFLFFDSLALPLPNQNTVSTFHGTTCPHTHY
jgi:hypothetical protein